MGKYIADQTGYLNDRLIQAGEVFEWQGEPKQEGRWFHKVGGKPKSPRVDVERIMMDGTFAAGRYKTPEHAAADNRHKLESEIESLRKALDEANENGVTLSKELLSANDALKRAFEQMTELEGEVESLRKAQK